MDLGFFMYASGNLREPSLRASLLIASRCSICEYDLNIIDI